LLVVDKERGGKADALNVALSSARYPIVVPVDADTIVAHDALLRLVRPFLLGEHVAAAGGTIRVANGCRITSGRVSEPKLPIDYLSAIQVPEYLRAFLFGRLGWNRLGGNLIVSGAFGLFQRHYLLTIGGYAADNVVEDLDLAAPKTKTMATMLGAMSLEGRHTLFILPREGDTLFKSLRNLNGVRVLRSHELNAYAVLWADNLVFTQNSLSGAEEVFGS